MTARAFGPAWFWVALWSSVAARPGSARAQAELPLELVWHAPAECPDAPAVRAELASIARVQPGHTLSSLHAEVWVTRAGQRYRVSLRTQHAGRHGSRRLDVPDCPSAARAVTLMLALAFGPGVRVDTAPTSPETPLPVASPAPDAVAAETPPSAAKMNVPVPELPASAATPARFVMTLAAGIGAGLLPRAAFTSALGVELELGALALGVQAQLWPTVSAALPANGTAKFDALAAALRVCGFFPALPLAVGLCAGPGLTAVRGRAQGSQLRADSALAPWYALRAGVTVGWPQLSAARALAWQLRLDASLAMSLNRPRFELEGGGPVQRVAQWSPQLMAAVAVGF